jgi:hypothetical protein
MNEFLSFRKMITPLFIQVIFWVLAALSVIGALVIMMQGGVMILAGLVYLVVAPFLIRIYCEVMIILFRIYDELVAIRTGTPPAAQGFPVIQPTPAAYPSAQQPPVG